MSKKRIGIIVSGFLAFVYILLSVVLYGRYLDSHRGDTTLGYYATAYNQFTSLAGWLIVLAAVWPMLLLLRRIRSLKPALRYGILGSFAIIVPVVFSHLSSFFYNQCIENIFIGLILPASFWLSILCHVISNTAYGFLIAAALHGLNLIPDQADEYIRFNRATAKAKEPLSYLEQYKQQRNGGAKNV